MMHPAIELILATTGLSLVISYAWWVHFRVWMFRQDLFTIRDDLWQSMLEAQNLDDPSHRQLRDSLNALIRVAPLLSVLTIFRTIAEGVLKREGIDAGEIPAQVVEARNKVILRLFRYLFLESLLGLSVASVTVICCLAIVFPLRKAQAYLKGLVARVLDSSQIITFGRLANERERVTV